MELKLSFVLIVLSTFTVVLGKIKTYHFISTDGDKSFPQDVSYDEDANTVLITVGDVSKHKRVKPSVNLHDFNTGYVAFKLIAEKKCFVAISFVKQPSIDLYKLGKSGIINAFNSTVNTTIMADVAATTGTRIADFCENYNTYWMELNRLPNKRFLEGVPDFGRLSPAGATLENAKTDTTIICNGCTVHCNAPETDVQV